MNKNCSCWKLIRSDLERLCKPSFLNFVKYYFFPSTPFKYQVWLRIWSRVKKRWYLLVFFGLYSYFRFHQLSFKYGIIVNANIPIGEGLKIVHSNGVYINAEYIGSNFTIFQGSTIGANHGVPYIKNNVTVYANSLVVGKITIGDNCVVGCMSLVNKTIEDGSIVCGIPAKKMNKETKQ